MAGLDRAHGGRVVAVPERPPIGSEGGTARSAGRDRHRFLAGVQILVVEDDELSRDALALLFSHYGAQVQTAASVPEAVRCFERQHPALLVSDIGLPSDADGYGLIRYIRSRDAERGQWTAAIAVSGLSPDDADPRILGFDDFLLKPVDIEQLLARILRLIRPDS